MDQSERFVFKPLLYELINGGASAEEVAPPFTQLLAPYSVNFVQARRLPSPHAHGIRLTDFCRSLATVSGCAGRWRLFGRAGTCM